MSLATTATPRVHSLLDRYGPLQKRPRKEAPRVQPIIIDDPYALDYPAVLRSPPERAKKPNPNEAEWQAPPKKPIEVLASARDLIAGMFTKRFIDKAMFLAARDYQSIYETASASRIKTVDPSMPPISGGRGSEAIDAVAAAAHRLKRIEKRLAKTYGDEAVVFVREVLGHGLTVERAAVRRGDGDAERDQECVRWWRGMFRRCLRELAETSGFAVKGAYRNRAREAERIERAERREEARKRHQAKRSKARGGSESK